MEYALIGTKNIGPVQNKANASVLYANDLKIAEQSVYKHVAAIQGGSFGESICATTNGNFINVGLPSGNAHWNIELAIFYQAQGKDVPKCRFRQIKFCYRFGFQVNLHQSTCIL